MRNNAGRMFLKGFVKSFFIVLILLGAGVLGYWLTIHYWGAPEEELKLEAQDDPVQESITQVSLDEVSKNLIYCYDKETNEINQIVLEIFHCKKNKITYITIPIRTQLMMSDELYRKLVLVQPAIPQIMQLSAMTGYFDSKTVFDYGVWMVEDLLGIKMSYYTVIPREIYDTMFEEKNPPTDLPEHPTLPIQTFTDEYISLLNKITTQEQLKTYMEEIYPTLESNLSLFQKMNYLEAYYMTPLRNVSFQLIKGNDTNRSYVIDEVLATQQLLELTKDASS